MSGVGVGLGAHASNKAQAYRAFTRPHHLAYHGDVAVPREPDDELVGQSCPSVDG
jgi:hypothetical protein